MLTLTCQCATHLFLLLQPLTQPSAAEPQACRQHPELFSFLEGLHPKCGLLYSALTDEEGAETVEHLVHLDQEKIDEMCKRVGLQSIPTSAFKGKMNEMQSRSAQGKRAESLQRHEQATSGTSTNESIADFLKRNSLEKYTSAIEEAEYAEVEDLLEADESELEKLIVGLKMAAPAKRRFLKAVAAAADA